MKLFGKPTRALERLHNLEITKRSQISPDLQRLLDIVQQVHLVKIDTDTTDGVKKQIEMHPLCLNKPEFFGLVHALAMFRPFVYAQTAAKPATFGVLSPNFDTAGVQRQSAIKFLPLRQNVPLTAKLKPDVNAAAMLAGGAYNEGQGMGGHGVGDVELQLTTMGAVASGNAATALQHRNHAVRITSSVVTGLTDGSLGKLYTPNSSETAFPGYGKPRQFMPETTDATIYIPHHFLSEPLAFGINFPNADEIMVARGMQTMELGLGSLIIATQRTEALARDVRAGTTLAHTQTRF